MQRTNNRCVVSLNISAEVAKCGKYSQIHPVHSLFCLLQKMTGLVWTIHSWQAFNSFVCPLMQRINNRCVESLNISVMSPNVENNHKFTQTDLSITKNELSWLNNLFMVMLSTHKDVSLIRRINYRCVE